MPKPSAEAGFASYDEVEKNLPELFGAALEVVEDVAVYNDHIAHSTAAPAERLAELQLQQRVRLPRVARPENMRRWDKHGLFARSFFIISGYAEIGVDEKRLPVPATATQLMGLVDKSFTPQSAMHGSLAHKPALHRPLAVPECAAILVPLCRAIGEHSVKHYMSFGRPEEKAERQRFARVLHAAQNILALSADKNDPHIQHCGRIDKRYLRR